MSQWHENPRWRSLNLYHNVMIPCIIMLTINFNKYHCLDDLMPCRIYGNNSSSTNLISNMFSPACFTIFYTLSRHFLSCYICLSLYYLAIFEHSKSTSSSSSEEGDGAACRRSMREVDSRLPLQFQERMQLIMIRDVPGKGQLKLQQA